MTAGLHDCMDVVAEFLFILCKENGQWSGGNRAGDVPLHRAVHVIAVGISSPEHQFE